MKKLLCLLLCGIIFCGVLCSCGNGDTEKYVLYYNMGSEPETLDPQAASDTSSKTVIMNIFEGLVTADKNGKISAGAASNYTVSDDGKNYVFTIREGAKWSNGEQLTSADFKFGITRALTNGICSELPEALMSITNAEEYNDGKVSSDKLGIKCLGNSTLNITLEKKNDDFLFALTQPAAMPCNENFFGSTSGQYGKEKDKIISNGTYCVDNGEWDHNVYIYIEGNPNYTGTRPPKCEGINLYIDSKDSENTISDIVEGKIDAAVAYGNQKKAAAENKLNVYEFSGAVWGLQFKLINSPKDSVVNNDNIRMALIQSIDRQQLLASVPDYDEATDIFGNGMQINGTSYRKQAGIMSLPAYSKNSAVMLSKGLKELKLEKLPEMNILCDENQSVQKAVSYIIECWNRISGTYANKEPVSTASLKSSVGSGDYTVAFAMLDYSSENPAECIASLAASGALGADNDVYNTFIAKLSTPDTMVQGCSEAEEYLIKKGIFYPVYYETNVFVSADCISGIDYYPYGGWVSFVNAVKTKSTK